MILSAGNVWLQLLLRLLLILVDTLQLILDLYPVNIGVLVGPIVKAILIVFKIDLLFICVVSSA